MTKKENKEEVNEPQVMKKDLDTLLAETNKKLTEKDFYLTIDIKLENSIIPFHFKPLNEETVNRFVEQPKNERVNFILTHTLYNPKTEKFYTIEELKPLMERFGMVGTVLTKEILKDAGFDEKYFKEIQTPF